MAHGDDKGLVVPPKLAPTQVVIQIVRDGEGVTEAAEALKHNLTDDQKVGQIDVQKDDQRGTVEASKILIDNKTSVSFGRRSTDWEIKGIPIRVELGPRDVEEGVGILVRRDTSEKTPVPLQELPQKISATLQTQQQDMLAKASMRLEDHTSQTTTLKPVSYTHLTLPTNREV